MMNTLTNDSRERVAPLVLAAMSLAWIVAAIEPFPVGVFQDDGIYTMLAKSLASGQGYRYLNLPETPNATHYPPLYPMFLAVLWKLSPTFPANVTLFKFANAAFIALAAVFGWRFARRNVGMGPWAAAISVGAFTACAPIVVLSVMVLSEPMFLAALFPVLMAGERAVRTGSRRDALIAGAAGGAFALVRTLGAVAIPATALALAFRRRWTAAALVMVAGTLVMLPWQLWVAANATALPEVFVGKYGSYSTWLLDGIRADGPVWVAKLVVYNLWMFTQQGWETMAVDKLPVAIRWFATAAVIAIFAAGWWRLLKRAPVAAWFVAGYLTLVASWPFGPARFTWAIWPLVGIICGLAVEGALSWRPQPRQYVMVRWATVAAASLLFAGYVRYNYIGTRVGFWTNVQSTVANRARPLAEWVAAYTPEDALIATDDDVLIHLYTGRRTIPNSTFTTQEYMTPQTPAFAAETLRGIMKLYDIDYVLASSDFGVYAAVGLMNATPPELRLLGALRVGAVYAPMPRGESQ
jgi:hypothetical protein